MNKQFWITIKQFLLFLFLSQGIMIIGVVATAIRGYMNGVKSDAMLDYVFESKITLWSIVLGYIITIVVFLGCRYVKIKTGRIERSRMWKTIGVAALIALGVMFSEAAIMELTNAERFFADEMEEMEMFSKLMSGALGGIAVGILGPISEEIGFRGVLMGGLLRMRCGAWPSIVISAIVFAVLHGTKFQLVGALTFGIILGWLYWRTKSLIPGMIIHIVNNSMAVILGTFAEDSEPDKLACVVLIVIFLPILIYGLKWFNRGGYQSCRIIAV